MNAPKHTLGTKSGTMHYMKTLRVVPGAGLEPARSCDRGILSPFSNLLCMPFKGIFGVIWWNKGSFKECKWVQFWVHKNKPAHQLPLGVNYPALKRVDTFGGLVLI